MPTPLSPLPRSHHLRRHPEEAFSNAKETLALILEDQTEPVPPNIQASHVIVGDIELNLPDPLLEEVRLFSEDKQPVVVS